MNPILSYVHRSRKQEVDKKEECLSRKAHFSRASEHFPSASHAKMGFIFIFLNGG